MKKQIIIILAILLAACPVIAGPPVIGGGSTGSLPSQSGASGKLLTSNGSVASWTATLTATMDDSAAQFYNSADNTKKVKIDPSNQGANQTGTIQAPANGTATLVAGTQISTDGTQTLTNKTLTTPVITFQETVKASTGDLTAAEASRGFVNNYGQSAGAIITLPAAAKGLTFVAIVGTKNANDWEFHHSGAETIYTDIGGTLTAGRAGIKCNNQEVGSRMSCATFQTGAASYSWLCGAISGTWTAVAP